MTRIIYEGFDPNDYEFKRFDVICYPYQYKSGILPPKKSKICKLSSSYMKISKLEINKLFEGKMDSKFYTTTNSWVRTKDCSVCWGINGVDCIVICKNLNNYDEALVIKKQFEKYDITCEVTGKTLQEYRDEKIKNILDGNISSAQK